MRHDSAALRLQRHGPEPNSIIAEDMEWSLKCSTRNMILKGFWLTILLASLSVLNIGLAQTAKDDVKSAGQDIKQAGKSTGSAAKKTGRATKKTVKKGVNKTAEKTEEGASKVEQKTR